MRRNYQKFVDEFLTETGMSGAEMARAIGLTADTIQGLRRGSISSPQHTTKQKINQFVLNYRKENKTKTTPQTQGHLFENLFDAQLMKSGMTLTAADGTQYISSRSVAEWTEKRHDHLTRDIENYIAILEEINSEESSPNLGNSITARIESYFLAGDYQAEGGQTYKLYWCSRKGCEMIANKMTGKKGVKFTAHYIEVFHAMEQALKADQPTPAPEKLTEATESRQTAPELPQGLREVERLYMDTLAKEIAKTDDMAIKMQLAERLTQLVQSMN